MSNPVVIKPREYTESPSNEMWCTKTNLSTPTILGPKHDQNCCPQQAFGSRHELSMRLSSRSGLTSSVEPSVTLDDALARRKAQVTSTGKSKRFRFFADMMALY